MNGEACVVDFPFTDLLSLSTLTLCTCGPDGQPHAAAVYFAADDDLNLFFMSDPKSQHGQDIIRDPRAAVAFHPECHGWKDIRGVQMRGDVQSVQPGDPWDHAWAVYEQKFPFVSELKDVVARNQFYVFIPEWVRLIDNLKGFGYKEEWSL